MCRVPIRYERKLGTRANTVGARTVEDVPDIPFGFALPGAQPPDPNDPQQMRQFMAQLQQLLASPGNGPVNWDLAKQSR